MMAFSAAASKLKSYAFRAADSSPKRSTGLQAFSLISSLYREPASSSSDQFERVFNKQKVEASSLHREPAGSSSAWFERVFCNKHKVEASSLHREPASSSSDWFERMFNKQKVKAANSLHREPASPSSDSFERIFNKQKVEANMESIPFTHTREAKVHHGDPAHIQQCSSLTDGFHSTDPFHIMKEDIKHRMECRAASTPSSCKLVVLGGPGVGKGSYAPFLSSWLCIPHISTGDLVRKELSRPASSCSTAGELMLREAARAAMNEGKLLDDAIILELLSNRLREMKPNVGFILDGFPRTIRQAHVLDDVVGGINMALSFNLQDDILVAKCMGRRVCNECGKNYNLAHVDLLTHEYTAEGVLKHKRIYLPAHLPSAECTSKLKVRAEDSNEATVRERLRLYACESKPVEQFYRLEGKLVEIDVGPGVRHVWPRLLDATRKFEQH